MEDEESTQELTTDSEYSDSFIATDDDLEEELTWDSEDSRPAGPSPDSDSDPEPRNRRRQRVIVLPDSQSDGSSQVSPVEIGSLTPERTHEDSLDALAGSDSDETYVSEMMDPRSSPLAAALSPEYLPPSPGVAAPRSPAPVPAPAPAPAPEVIEIPSSPPQPENVPEQSAPPVAESKPADEKLLDCSVNSEGDDASLCTICMCPLTNSGDHRVVCLACGHIFGQSCVTRWIKVGCNGGAKRCPSCNKKAAIRDIRVLFLPKVIPLDTSERDRLMQEKEELAAQKKMLESDFTRTVLQHKLVVARYEERIAALEKRLMEGTVGEAPLAALSQPASVTVVTTASISPDGGCRVMAFNAFRQDMVVSQPSGNTVFAGFGVRMLNSVDWQPARFVLLHTKAVRDLRFHPEDRHLLLSVSLDANAKLFDLGANTTVHTFKGEGPLWSCCWDAAHPHLLLLGSQSGKVAQYDRRMTDHCVRLWETDHNKTPVVALASTPCRAGTPYPQGGFLSCRLNTVFSYARQGEDYGCQELGVEGPFMSMRYDGATQMMLTTSRPSSRSPHTRVCLSLLDCDGHGKVCAPMIHTFQCGSSARVMSRSAVLPVADDSLVVAHNESGRTLDMWSAKGGDHLHSVPVREPVIDLAPVPLCNNKPPLLAALSEKKLYLYKIN